MASTQFDYKHVVVADALKTHEKDVAELLSNLSDLKPTKEEGLDELFALRFLLSNGSIKAAEKNMRETIAWRRANATAITRMRTEGRAPNDEICSLYQAYAHHGELKDGSPIVIVRAGLTDVPSMLKAATPEQIVDWMLFQREEVFAICDKKTRETGRIVKVISIVDQNHSRLAGADRRFFDILGSVSKKSEIYYPQMLGISILLNMPSFFSWVLSIAKMILPRKLMEKTRFCPGQTLTDSIAKCPFSAQLLDIAAVPTFLGGKCTCEHQNGCIRGVPNDFVGVLTPETLPERAALLGGGKSAAKISAAATAVGGKHDDASALASLLENLQLSGGETKEIKIPVPDDTGDRTFVYTLEGDGVHFEVTALPSKKVLLPDLKVEGVAHVSGQVQVPDGVKELSVKLSNHSKLKKKHLSYSFGMAHPDPE